MFREMGVKTFYIGKLLDDPQRSDVIFQGLENIPKDIFMKPEKILLFKPLCIFKRVQK